MRYQASEHVARAGETAEVEGRGGAGITVGDGPEAMETASREDRGAGVTVDGDIIVRCADRHDGPSGEDEARDMRAARIRPSA